MVTSSPSWIGQREINPHHGSEHEHIETVNHKMLPTYLTRTPRRHFTSTRRAKSMSPMLALRTRPKVVLGVGCSKVLNEENNRQIMCKAVIISAQNEKFNINGNVQSRQRDKKLRSSTHYCFKLSKPRRDRDVPKKSRDRLETKTLHH